MEFYRSFSIEQGYRTIVSIQQEYNEHVRHVGQTGGDHVVIYDLIILPNNSDNIVLYFEDNEQPEEWCTHPTKECVPYISEGVEAFIKRLHEKRVTCNGFDMWILNAVVHPVDFRPSYYRKFTTQRLVQRFNEIAKADIL